MEGGKIKNLGLYPDSAAFSTFYPRFTCLKSLIGLGGVREKATGPADARAVVPRSSGCVGKGVSMVLGPDLLN